MDRTELKNYIMEFYSAEPDFPWIKYPDYEVFRHRNNHKWFALIMDVPKAKLGLTDEGIISVVNLKCDPIIIGNGKITNDIKYKYFLRGTKTFNRDHKLSYQFSEGGKEFTYPEINEKDY